MSSAPTLPLLYLHHSSFSNHSVASPTSQLILQPFFCFSYITGSSLMSPSEPPTIHNLKDNFFYSGYMRRQQSANIFLKPRVLVVIPCLVTYQPFENKRGKILFTHQTDYNHKPPVLSCGSNRFSCTWLFEALAPWINFNFNTYSLFFNSCPKQGRVEGYDAVKHLQQDSSTRGPERVFHKYNDVGEATERLQNDLTQVKWRKGWRMSCDVGEAPPHSPTLTSLHLRHSSFYSPPVASPTLQALHLRHLKSRPCPCDDV